MSLAPARTVAPRSSIEPGGLLGTGDELFEALTGLMEARFGHRLHRLWHLETVLLMVTHDRTPSG